MGTSEGASEWRLMRWGVTAGKRGALFFILLTVLMTRMTCSFFKCCNFDFRLPLMTLSKKTFTGIYQRLFKTNFITEYSKVTNSLMCTNSFESTRYLLELLDTVVEMMNYFESGRTATSDSVAAQEPTARSHLKGHPKRSRGAGKHYNLME